MLYGCTARSSGGAKGTDAGGGQDRTTGCCPHALPTRTTHTRTQTGALCCRPPPHARTTSTRTHEVPRVAWRFVCGPPGGARCCRPPPHARTTSTHACWAPLLPSTTRPYHTHAHVAWRFTRCWGPGTRSAARCLALHVRAACWEPLLPSTTTSTHTLLGASHVAGARCCFPPPHARTARTGTHAKRRALLGASCAGRLLGPAAAVHRYTTAPHDRTPGGSQCNLNS